MKPKNLRAPGAFAFTRQSSLVFALAISALLSNQAHAADRTWNGGGADTDWLTAGNWDTLPVADDTLILAGTVQAANTNNFAADTSFSGLSFTNTLNGQSFSLSGNRITLGGNITTTGTPTTGDVISDSIGLNMILSGARTITANTRHNLTISGNISEDATPRSLTKAGAGTLTLTGTNTYTGGTVINAGGVVLANAGSGNTLQGAITISGSGRLLLGKSNQISDTSVITFSSGANSGRFQLANAAGTGYNETIGGITDAAGTFTSSRIVESASDGISNSPGTLTINTATGQSYNFGGIVRDAVGGATNSALSIVKDGLGTQEFSGGSVNHTGSTTVKAGILKLSGNTVINNSAISLEGGSIEFAGGGAITRSTAISSTVSTGGVIKSGAGTLTFTGDNTYTGTTVVTNGTLRLDRTGGTIADTGTVIVNSDAAILDVAQSDTIGTLGLGNSATVSGAGTLTVTTAIAPNIALNKTNTISASLAGDAFLRKTGQGTTILSAANSYTGGTILSGNNSKLTISGAGTLGSTSGSLSIETASAILDLGGTSQTVGSLSAVGTVTNGTLNVSTQLSLGDPLISNSIGSATFDSLTMGSVSTYSFGLEGGTMNSDLGNITGALNITSGSILDLVQLGTYNLGDKFTLFAYTAAGGLTGTFEDTNSISLADGDIFADAGGSWMIDYDDASAGLNGGTGDRFVTITAIPEPGAAMLLGGLGMLSLLRRRRG